MMFFYECVDVSNEKRNCKRITIVVIVVVVMIVCVCKRIKKREKIELIQRSHRVSSSRSRTSYFVTVVVSRGVWDVLSLDFNDVADRVAESQSILVVPVYDRRVPPDRSVDIRSVQIIIDWIKRIEFSPETGRSGMSGGMMSGMVQSIVGLSQTFETTGSRVANNDVLQVHLIKLRIRLD